MEVINKIDILANIIDKSAYHSVINLCTTNNTYINYFNNKLTEKNIETFNVTVPIYFIKQYIGYNKRNMSEKILFNNNDDKKLFNFYENKFNIKFKSPDYKFINLINDVDIEQHVFNFLIKNNETKLIECEDYYEEKIMSLGLFSYNNIYEINLKCVTTDDDNDNFVPELYFVWLENDINNYENRVNVSRG